MFLIDGSKVSVQKKTPEVGAAGFDLLHNVYFFKTK